MVQHAKDIAIRALSLRDDDRRRFLERSCAGDDDLRTQVERLLSLDDGATIVPSPPTEFSTERLFEGIAEPDAERPAARSIGGYRVRSVLGTGAMGEVFLAEQPSPRRLVALKLIRAGRVTESARRRFEEETRLLARLKHPGIATIHEAGTASVHGADCPYFAMEYVEGHPLDEHAVALPLRERVALIIEVCAAVEHAHQRGIVHRDLKPGNVLVDHEGRPKILDFGVARALGDEAASERVGTIPYMAPEQLAASADADTRIDVYAVGVMLYELIAGRRPHALEGLSVADAAALVGEVPPTPLRTVCPTAPRDLASITDRALARDPDRRFPSASALADDLRRWLERRPISARQHTPWYVTRRFVQRNRGLSIAALVAALALASGAAGVAWQAVEATRGWTQARQEADRTAAVSGFLGGLLASADPENALGEELTVRELLDISAATVGTELQDQPAVEAAVRLTLATTYRSLGDLDAAQTHGAAAVEASREAFGAGSPRERDAKHSLAVTSIELGHHDEAEAALRDILASIEAEHGPDSVESAYVQSDLARVAHETGRAEEAVTLWRQSLETVRGSDHADPARTLVLEHNYGSALGALGRYDEAVEVLSGVVEQRAVLYGNEHPQTVGARSMLAGVLQKQGRNDEAAVILRDVLAARLRLFGNQHHTTLTAMGNLGVTLIQLGELPEAEQLVRLALNGYRDALGADHAKTLIMMGNLAYLLEDLGRPAEAEALYREQIAARERSTGGRDPETWSSYNNLAMLLQTQGRFADAIPLYERLLDLCRETLPAGHVYTALFENNYGECLMHLGRYDDAATALEASHEVLVGVFGESHDRVVKSRGRLESLRALRGR